ncbi:hypothetical protein Cs7R123_65670 [Catellatospora sp. TT07R-123]|uniref:hypothetical protein n=1 Tax=Catellatospora sp. TT07R-123 TaxID=2733863 RepID=UPI001B2F403C|nr:hypothetical protein [Catellatospora sp. TT07R-123]GHJ49225.1 hypothetical protein Cs7R123_65670 [Catellatospora sp. TT07R-123]
MRPSPRDLLAPLLVALALLLPGTPAYAEKLGGLVVYPGASLDTASIKVVTARGCPSTADAYYVKVRGHGFPADGLVVTQTTDAGLSHTDGFAAYFALTMMDFAADQHTKLSGTYDVTLYCIDAFTQESRGEFTGSIRFSSPTRYQAVGAAMPPPSPSAVPGASASPGVGTPAPGAGSGDPALAAGAPSAAAAATRARPKAAEGGWVIWLVCTAAAVGLVWAWQRRKAWLDAGPRRSR